MVFDLRSVGVPFIERYDNWRCWQPLTGEYVFTRSLPDLARVDFTGDWFGCFDERIEALIQFPAFGPVQTTNQATWIPTRKAIEAALDVCNAGLVSQYDETALLVAGFTKTATLRRNYLMLSTMNGTLITEEPQNNANWHAYFVEQQITPTQLQSWLTKEIWNYHDFNNDQLGRHRVKIGSMSFWEVMHISKPAPAFGGSRGGILPASFLYGVLNYMAKYPLWYLRFGQFPKEI